MVEEPTPSTAGSYVYAKTFRNATSMCTLPKQSIRRCLFFYSVLPYTFLLYFLSSISNLLLVLIIKTKFIYESALSFLEKIPYVHTKHNLATVTGQVFQIQENTSCFDCWIAAVREVVLAVELCYKLEASFKRFSISIDAITKIIITTLKQRDQQFIGSIGSFDQGVNEHRRAVTQLKHHLAAYCSSVKCSVIFLYFLNTSKPYQILPYY